jgi:hypothetical protein
MQWPTLPILDWLDIDIHSRAYAFLKEIGVREVPILSQLIDRIIDEHNEYMKRNQATYTLPISLRFLAEHFQQHYSKLWKTAKIQRPFLPSYSSTKALVLTLPENVFQGKINEFELICESYPSC